MLHTIYLDLDGVLCDFVTAAVRLHGREDLLQPGVWPKGHYALEDLLRIPPGQFWAPINAAGARFWADLEPYDWMHDLLDTAQCNAREVVLLSKPSRCPSSSAGKHAWIRGHFGKHFEHYILTPKKYHCAAPDRLLIDDCEANVEHWRKAGGQALLFPQPWNNGQGTVDTVLEELARLAS